MSICWCNRLGCSHGAARVIVVPPYYYEDPRGAPPWPTPGTKACELNVLADFHEDTLVEFDVTSDPADFGATHVLVYEDGTEELLCIDGNPFLVKVS